MPLGKLSKSQLSKGTKVLEEIEEELKKSNPNIAFLTDASNRFYTIIPQDFGTDRPPIIDNKQLLQEKYDLLAVGFSLSQLFLPLYTLIITDTIYTLPLSVYFLKL
jgi:hypothetical protein